MQVYHNLPLTLIFSIIYCCMVGSTLMDQHFNPYTHPGANLDGNLGLVPRWQLHLPRATPPDVKALYDALNGDAQSGYRGYCEGQFSHAGNVYTVSTLRGSVIPSKCKKLSDSILSPGSQPIQLHNRLHGQPGTWPAARIVVSGFRVEATGLCLSLENLGNRAEEGKCAYIAISLGEFVPDGRGAPADPTPGPRQVIFTPETKKLKAGLEAVLKEKHGGPLCGTEVEYEGQQYRVQRRTRCTYSKCLEYKNLGSIITEPLRPKPRVREAKRRGREKPIIVTGFERYSDKECLAVSDQAPEGHTSKGLGICAMIWVMRPPNQDWRARRRAAGLASTTATSVTGSEQ